MLIISMYRSGRSGFPRGRAECDRDPYPIGSSWRSEFSREVRATRFSVERCRHIPWRNAWVRPSARDHRASARAAKPSEQAKPTHPKSLRTKKRNPGAGGSPTPGSAALEVVAPVGHTQCYVGSNWSAMPGRLGFIESEPYECFKRAPPPGSGTHIEAELLSPPEEW